MDCLSFIRVNTLTVLIALALMVATLQAAARPYEGYPGGVVYIPVQDISESLYFNNSRLLILDNGTGTSNNKKSHLHQEGQSSKRTGRFAIVGIPVKHAPGTAYVERMENGKLVKAYEIKIANKEYPTESITIKDKTKVNPPKRDFKRIKSEAELLNRVLSNFEQQKIEGLTLAKPAQGRISSEFGFRRIINGQPKNHHRGIDIAAPIGAPVHASANGTVTLAQDLFFTGNTVVVDHGQGWQTIYCHLDSIDVAINQPVTTESKIGTVGKTGRATGPHLHFGMILNQARVDPSLFWNDNN